MVSFGIAFYSFSSHCNKLEPEYHSAAEELIGMSSSSKLAKVNVKENPELFDRYNMVGYPTLLFFK